MLNIKAIWELMNVKEIKSLYELSVKTKIPYTTLNYMFRGHDMHVSSLIELAHFFNVPVDDLINKYYGFTVFTDDQMIECATSNVYEATVSTMM